MLRVLPVVILIALYVYVLIDLATSPSPQVRTRPKLVWRLVILVIPVLGAVAWLVLGRPRTAPGGGGGGGGGLRSRLPGPEPRGPSGYAQGPVAPDDDPDFLRKIDEKRRRDERHGRPGDSDT